MKTDDAWSGESGGRCRSQVGYAFTRLDFVTATAALLLLGAIAIRPVTTHKAETLRAGCLNNLRQVGYGFRMWASDHNDSYPPLVEVADGGTRRHQLSGNAWIHFAVASNGLRTPKILACPADEATRVATDFSASPLGGLLNPAYRNNAISYFIAHPYPDFAGDILTGDRNFTNNGFASCSYFPYTATLSLINSTNMAGWTNGLHFGRGNAVLQDGRAEPFSNEAITLHLRREEAGARSFFHFLAPR